MSFLKVVVSCRLLIRVCLLSRTRRASVTPADEANAFRLELALYSERPLLLPLEGCSGGLATPFDHPV